MTTFIVTTIDSLQPDYFQITATLLVEQVKLLRAAGNVTAINAHQEKYFFPWLTRKPGGHPPQSSGVSGNLGLHEVYQGAQALQGTPGFPRVTEAL